MIITTKSQSAKIGSKISFHLKMNHVPPFITIGICFDNFSGLMDYMYYIIVFVRLVYVVSFSIIPVSLELFIITLFLVVGEGDTFFTGLFSLGV